MTDESKHRDLKLVTEPIKVQTVLKNHLAGKSMFMKGASPPPEVKIISFVNYAKNEILVDAKDLPLEQNVDIVLYRVLGRYIEVTCRYLRKDPTSGYSICAAITLSIASKERQHLRLPIAGDEVYITNFRTSKQSIDATMFNIPTSVKVNFSLYEQRLKSTADIVKIDVYSKRDTRFDEVRKSGKPLLLKDTEAPSSYAAPSEQYLDFAKYLGIDITKQMEVYKKAKIKSEVIYPLIYGENTVDPVPLGYILLQSRTRHFDELTIQTMQKHAQELVEKIQDTNTVMIREKQKVINLSQGGLKVLITDQELKNYLLRQHGFTADIVFRKQAPITLYTTIRAATRTAGGDLLLGLQIAGNSSRENEMARYQDNLTIIEEKIKALRKK